MSYTLSGVVRGMMGVSLRICLRGVGEVGRGEVSRWCFLRSALHHNRTIRSGLTLARSSCTPPRSSPRTSTPSSRRDPRPASERARERGEGEFRRQSPRRTRGKTLFCERTKRDVVRLTFHGALNGSPSRKVLTLDRAPLTFFAILLPARGVGVGVGGPSRESEELPLCVLLWGFPSQRNWKKKVGVQI